MTGKDDIIQKINTYRDLVVQYEALDEAIDTLLDSHSSEDSLTAEEMRRYRELARQRDDVQNAMRVLEEQLQMNDIDV